MLRVTLSGWKVHQYRVPRWCWCWGVKLTLRLHWLWSKVDLWLTLAHLLLLQWLNLGFTLLFSFSSRGKELPWLMTVNRFTVVSIFCRLWEVVLCLSQRLYLLLSWDVIRFGVFWLLFHLVWNFIDSQIWWHSWISILLEMLVILRLHCLCLNVDLLLRITLCMNLASPECRSASLRA